FLYALFNLMTRRLAAYDPPETIQYLPAVGAAILLAPFALAAWESPSGWQEWTLACLLGVVGGLGHYLLALGHRYAPATALAPASAASPGRPRAGRGSRTPSSGSPSCRATSTKGPVWMRAPTSAASAGSSRRST